eukprot:TRINITY_DN76165_c0_g1_i1.p1 TRINITY_DN76165_c0_g1~~TRINITY_DN76165_c0_g1_i1.p1  ORF type:complete len:257 (+),score=51.78 TRINITY_DN76165_c0_g1_i1:58-771(+)
MVFSRLRWFFTGHAVGAQLQKRCRGFGSFGSVASKEQLALALETKPWPPWLASEMRSNWAGETGAVAIYKGCQAALPKVRCPKARAALQAFAEEHVAAEEAHLAAIDVLVCERKERSWMPATSFGWGLGFMSTAARGARGMYVTTHAVETFVEEHYGDQIARLESELRLGDRSPAEAYRALLSLLRAACADEVHHKEDAASHAAAFGICRSAVLADRLQYQLVYWGSRIGAAMAKRL